MTMFPRSVSMVTSRVSPAGSAAGAAVGQSSPCAPADCAGADPAGADTAGADAAGAAVALGWLCADGVLAPPPEELHAATATARASAAMAAGARRMRVEVMRRPPRLRDSQSLRTGGPRRG